MRIAALPLLCAAACSSGRVAVGDSADGAVVACAASAVPTVVATAPGLIADFKVDASNVYFTGTNSPTTAYISSAPLCGGPVDHLGFVDPVMDGCFTGASGPALAVSESEVYFLDMYGVGSVSKSGGSVSVIAETACGDAGSAFVLGGSFLYWMRSPISATKPVGDILRMPQGGGVPTEIATDVVIDSAGSVADATNYYWAGLDGTINRVALSGGPVTVLVPAPVGFAINSINGLALDATYVYFALSTTCNPPIGAPPCPTPSPTAAPIMRVPIAGGAATTVVTDYNVGGIAVDGKNVYWIDPYDSVKWAPLGIDDGAAVANVLATDSTAYVGPVLTDGAVYWVSDNQIKFIAKPH
jgi:hypothetical protein